MPILSQHRIASLTFQEKIALIDELWASLDSSEVELSLDNAYDHLLVQRLADGDAEMDQLFTLDTAIRQVREMLKGAQLYAISAIDAA